MIFSLRPKSLRRLPTNTFPTKKSPHVSKSQCPLNWVHTEESDFCFIVTEIWSSLKTGRFPTKVDQLNGLQTCMHCLYQLRLEKGKLTWAVELSLLKTEIGGRSILEPPQSNLFIYNLPMCFIFQCVLCSSTNNMDWLKHIKTLIRIDLDGIFLQIGLEESLFNLPCGKSNEHTHAF